MNDMLLNSDRNNGRSMPGHVLRIPSDMLPVVFSFFLVGMTGLIPQSMTSLGMLGMAVWMGLKGNLYLMYPITLFYYSYLGTVTGMSFFRVYNLLFFAVSLLLRRKKIGVGLLPMAIVYILYSLLIMYPYNQTQALFYIIIVVNLILLKNFYLDNATNVRNFWRVFVISALLSFVSGLINNNVMVDTNQVVNNELVTFSRYMGLFNDPNYMGLFYSVAVFAVVSMKLFNKKANLIIIVVLYTMLFSTLSMTAILGNAIFWLIYLAMQKKIRPKFFVYIVLIGGVMVGLYFYSLQRREIPVIGSLAFRINGKLAALATGDLNYVTTGRTTLSAAHWQYFISQPVLKLLFGGNLVNSFVIDLPIGKFAAHNEYVDILLNVGVLGASIIWGTVLLSVIQVHKRKDSLLDGQSSFQSIMKIILLYYAATLTMFLEPRFMLFFFL